MGWCSYTASKAPHNLCVHAPARRGRSMANSRLLELRELVIPGPAARYDEATDTPTGIAHEHHCAEVIIRKHILGHGQQRKRNALQGRDVQLAVRQLHAIARIE